MSTILVVDDMAIFREPIAAALRMRGFDTRVAVDGTEALEETRRSCPDLILLDVAMPGMDGLSFLKALRSDPRHQDTPVILLSAMADRECILQAGKLGVQDYLLKSHFSLDELVARVRRRLEPDSERNESPRAGGESGADAAAKARKMPAAGARNESPAASGAKRARPAPIPADRSQSVAGLKPITSREELIQLVTEGLELKPMAPVVQNVISATSNPQCSADDVAKAVGQDQVLSLRILRLANSLAHSRGRQVDTIKAAVGRIGIREVRNLVMTLSVLQHYDGAVSAHVDPHLFWEHSIGCGILASAIARQCGAESPDDYFLWGLLHDVGRMVLIEHLPDKYAQVWETAESLGVPLEAVEAKLMVLDHCHVLGRALEHWRFPREFIAPAVSHHLPISQLRQLKPPLATAAMIVALANRIAKALLIGSSGNLSLYPLMELSRLVGLKEGAVALMEEAVLRDARDLRLTLLSRMSDRDWPELAVGLKAELLRPIRPLFASLRPDLDPVRMCIERLSAPGTGDLPNLSVAYLTDAREWPKVWEQLRAVESEAGVELPALLVVCDQGPTEAMQKQVADRQHAVLTAPVQIKKMIATINSMLALTGEG